MKKTEFMHFTLDQSNDLCYFDWSGVSLSVANKNREIWIMSEFDHTKVGLILNKSSTSSNNNWVSLVLVTSMLWIEIHA